MPFPRRCYRPQDFQTKQRVHPAASGVERVRGRVIALGLDFTLRNGRSSPGNHMSTITEKDVEYVANLAQLNLDDALKARLVGELGNILDYIGKLNELDTDGVEPMMHVQALSNVFRDDEIAPSLPREIVMENAPKHDGEYFLVPQILDGD